MLVGGWLEQTLPLEGLGLSLGGKAPPDVLGAGPSHGGVGQGWGVGQTCQCGWSGRRERQSGWRSQHGGTTRGGVEQALLSEEAVQRVTKWSEEQRIQGPITELSLPHALQKVWKKEDYVSCMKPTCPTELEYYHWNYGYNIITSLYKYVQHYLNWPHLYSHQLHKHNVYLCISVIICHYVMCRKRTFVKHIGIAKKKKKT